ncbi:MAG: hypothetical protein K2H17_05655, partial [Duncaniella sp.]|uniref:hypothetical protein n=1 Tax=Duncaniella sp. TaxID=2518496 RepID=UPI0023C5AFE2
MENHNKATLIAYNATLFIMENNKKLSMSRNHVERTLGKPASEFNPPPTNWDSGGRGKKIS